jgi:lipoyl(octanoyl) transferase
VKARPQIFLTNLGLVDYTYALNLQQQLNSQLIKGEISEQLLICCHPNIITIGKSGSLDSILVDSEHLTNSKVDVQSVNRGGNITLHTPKQIIGYPIIDLRQRRQDVAWYMRLLEEVLIQTLAEIGLSALRYAGKTGVWIERENKLRKIASLGVKISRWCTYHGFALYNDSDADLFRFIKPCGESETEVTAVQLELGRMIHRDELERILVTRFMNIFDSEVC